VPQPLSIMGADLGTRMSVMRVGESIALHSPVRIDDALAKEIDKLGRVRWIIAPCAFHHFYLKKTKARWPEAEVLAPPGLEKKNVGVAIDTLLPAIPKEWAGLLDAHFVEGMPRLNEVAFLHQPSKTLVLTDFVFNIPELDGIWGRTMLSALGSYGGPRQSKIFRLLMRDRDAVRKSRDTILGWDFDRVSVCHRDPITTGGRESFEKITAWI
jgi:hypothetical protein